MDYKSHPQGGTCIETTGTCILKKLSVEGEFACFTRPELKTDRVSYETITPSAAKNILNCILKKPIFEWVITEILVHNPIKFISIKRNETTRKVKRPFTSAMLIKAGASGADFTQRNSLILKDVKYTIIAYMVFEEGVPYEDTIKCSKMYNRRVELGQCTTRPYLGCREFVAFFSPVIVEEPTISVSKRLGKTIHTTERNEDGSYTFKFFDAGMYNGRIPTHDIHLYQNQET